jgi:hypothetical protein
MSSPRLRAAAFNSLVMLNTYAGSRVSLLNSSILLFYGLAGEDDPLTSNQASPSISAQLGLRPPFRQSIPDQDLPVRLCVHHRKMSGNLALSKLHQSA